MHLRSIPLLLLALTTPAIAQQATFGPCYAHWSPTELTIGNAHIERKWTIEGHLLRATSFYDRDTHTEWLTKLAKTPTTPPESLTITAQSGPANPVEAPSLQIEIRTAKSVQYRLQIFPDATGIEVDLQPGQPVPTAPANTAAPSSSISEQEFQAATEKNAPPVADELSLVPQHLRLTQVTFNTDTDHNDQLVFTNEWMFMNNQKDLTLSGNLFVVEDVITASGLIFLKQAALPEARMLPSPYDLRVLASPRTFRFVATGYPTVVLAYTGGRAGRIEALQTYQRQLRQYDPNRDGQLLSNTWGDRNRDTRINADFASQEITAGAKLGVDIVQIDDGWQAGRSTNSARGPGIPGDFWSTQTPFWAVDPQRFPHGLAPLIAATTANHMKLGLWYAPDSSHEFQNWQRDANQILTLFRQQNIAYFKFDSINVTTPKAEANLHQLFDRILTESKGAITIDLDVTGTGRRPGYFGLMSSGPIFVENRYTDFHRYWPHLTLRALWELAQYVDPLRLRMEFLNNTRNQQRYPNDPLAPANYSPDALFATVMVSNPLAWLEISSLPPAFTASVAPVVATWKQHREALYNGTIIPVGSDPDGVSWTGFASISKQSPTGSVLIFRELNDQPDWTLHLPLLHGKVSHATILAGHGTASVDGDRLVVHIPERLQYIWVSLDQ